ncbi:hypothetical protein [Pedobacter zeae]|uniref:Uncharacterized protein n=1 Tax=Pedobacter zeae TaxID=1737356 RepID=A0A7W6P6V1_9SPHI|nr:hypothetical protein [Pedobacter zeae]MBB4108336.1 hypothetical protein [Pedobacter zeae]GGG93470.1 hypothetical protein GCM10007422_03370 [Pedobacter zeae]
MNVERLLKQVLNEPEKHVKALNSFKETYEGLQIGEYSMDILTDVIENGTFNISERFKEAATAQLDKSGITSPLLKANLLKGCNEVVSQFEQAIDGLVKSAIDVNDKAEFDRITDKQMKVEGVYVGGNCIRNIHSEYKLLRTGRVKGGLVTKCNKVIDIDSSQVRIDNDQSDHFLYAKWPRSGGMAVLSAFKEPKENTEKNFYIFWQSGLFHEINI